MKTKPAQYYLPSGSEPEEFFKGFDTLGRLRVDPARKVQRTYLDTFDWRLHAAGCFLVEEWESATVRTSLRRLGDHGLLGHVMGPAPRYAWDLPTGPLRAVLEPLIAIRALLPVARVDIRSQRAVLLNKRHKTVLRLVIEGGQIDSGPGGADQRIPMRLDLEPIKGYRKPLAQAQEIVQQQLALAPAPDIIDEALELLGREPEDYNSKLDIVLHPEMPSGEALCIVLRDLLDTFECNLEGTRQDLDSEFLHDVRVAVRRTRSLLSQIRGVLPDETVDRFRPDFKWLGQITGPTRDLDVYLLKLPAYRDSLPRSMQADLQPLSDYLLRHQRQAQRRLARQLGSTRCSRLRQEWRKFLETQIDPITWPDKAARPIIKIANNRTWKAYRLVLRKGIAITDESPPSALHELRISCKKLRYLMEFFQSLYPPKLIRRQIQALKGLQDNLGDFHDLEVQARTLKDFGHAMQTEQADLPSETFMAMGVLIDTLKQHQDAERRNFAERFDTFASPANQKLCRGLFNPATGPAEQT